MARPSLPTQFDVSPQYYSIVTKEDDTVLGQVKGIEPSITIDSTKAGRVGSSTKKTLKKSKEGSLSLEIWADDDLAELATALNRASAPSSGETVTLDPDASPITLKVKKYDAEASSANLLSTMYLYNYQALEWSLALDEDGEEVHSISGDVEDIYTVLA